MSSDSGMPRPTRAVAEGNHLSVPGASSLVPMIPNSHISLPLLFASSTESLQLFNSECLREHFSSFLSNVSYEQAALTSASREFRHHLSIFMDLLRFVGLHLRLTFSLVKTTVLCPSSLPHRDLHYRERLEDFKLCMVFLCNDMGLTA